MIVVGSSNAAIGLETAWDILSGGGTALDAVEAAVRLVEDDPTDHTVGLGGYPNIEGTVELDASIMDGTTRRAGAVGGLRGYREAITVARAVMERLPHVLVVGDGAAMLAEEIGLRRTDLLTPEAEGLWRAGLDGLPTEGVPLSQLAQLATDPERVAGTVNVIAQDAEGRIASAVSTSGWAWKYPGRLGDTPVIGAGNYCDDRYGAAGCTGLGELSMRSLTAFRIVAAMSVGASVAEACLSALQDLSGLGMEDAVMHAVAIDADGNHAGASTRKGRQYAIRTEGGTELLDRVVAEA